ncbi:glycoside hydrolase family 16 protein [Streptomyces sp. SM14]|uniref:glycoside hydrolase family 16 protein n=1 Tax=Streptomyces sp. SM14 TaxID=1736045 RepID=UPI0027E4A059|nr:glycoside hydrolase family 16 protein [Streptomyces sp. SM14]
MNSPARLRPRHRRLAATGAALGLSAALLAAGTANGSTPTGTAAEEGPGATVVLHDDFDGPAGAPVDSAHWNLDPGDNINNLELQYYTTGTDNTALDGNGNLVITAESGNPGNYDCWYGSCEYTSGRINTAGKIEAEYGRVEARIQLPEGQGVWPAFWMLGTDFGDVGWPQSGEIDIMELVGHEMDTVHGTVHGPGYSGGGGIGSPYTLPGGESFSDDFHTFAVDWAPDRVSWSVDGDVYQTLTPADVNGEWVFNKPFFLILNVAVGGEWPGYPDDSTEFPQRMVVDYVSVTELDGAAG